jgi:hypothetical protein
MAIYRCYFFNSGGHIIGTEDLAGCSDEREARRAAISLLNSQARYCGISVWEGDRKIFAEFIPISGQSGIWPMDRAA